MSGVGFQIFAAGFAAFYAYDNALGFVKARLIGEPLRPHVIRTLVGLLAAGMLLTMANHQ